MKSMTVTLMTPSGKAVQALSQFLQEKLNAVLHMVTIEPQAFSDYTDVRLSAGGAAWNKTQTKQIVDAVSEAIAGYIVREEEEKLLRAFISGDYGYDEHEEIVKVLGYCRQVLEKDGQIGVAESAVPVKSKREQRMVKQIRTFLTEHERLNINGFLRFRANAYRDELLEVVEFAIDEYLMDKQYQEFISLLKYFVYIQDTKIPAAHLMHKGGHEFVLLNDQLMPIDTSQFDSTFTVELLDKEINFEDLIVSTLITVAPQKIFIHTRDPELQVIKTITQIFEGRVSICEYCRQCKPVLGERKKQDQLYT